MARRVSHLVYASKGNGIAVLQSGLAMSNYGAAAAISRVENLGGGFFRYVLAAAMAPPVNPYVDFPAGFGVRVTGAPDAGNNINQGLVQLDRTLDAFVVFNPAGVAAGAGGSANVTTAGPTLSPNRAAGILFTAVSLQVGRRYRIADVSLAPSAVQGFTPSGTISVVGSLYMQQADRNPFRQLMSEAVLTQGIYYAYLWSVSLAASIHLPLALPLADKLSYLSAIPLQAEELTVARASVPIGHGVYIEGTSPNGSFQSSNFYPFEPSLTALESQGIIDILPLSLQSYVPAGVTEFVASKPFLMVYPQIATYPNQDVGTPQTYIGRLRFSLEELG